MEHTTTSAQVDRAQEVNDVEIQIALKVLSHLENKLMARWNRLGEFADKYERLGNVKEFHRMGERRHVLWTVMDTVEELAASVKTDGAEVWK
jgi:hypothetical protein